VQAEGFHRDAGRRCASVPTRPLLESVLLRSQSLAVYAPDNIGHFGLALEAYAHFTSPIRRYPDLLVHRAIKHALAGGKPDKYTYSPHEMAALSLQCSERARRADEAEREVDERYRAAWMEKHVGKEVRRHHQRRDQLRPVRGAGRIQGQRLVHVTQLPRDYLPLRSVRKTLTGERRGHEYRLGDRVRIVVLKASVEDRKIDFRLVERRRRRCSTDADAGTRQAEEAHEAEVLIFYFLPCECRGGLGWGCLCWIDLKAPPPNLPLHSQGEELRQNSAMSKQAQWIVGLNAVASALEHDAEHVREVLLEAGGKNPRIAEIEQEARRKEIDVRRVAQNALDGVAGGVRHQGAAARYAAAKTWDEHELVGLVEAAGGKALVLVLDGVQDPHNLGACLRSAAAAGATAVVFPKDKAVQVNATVRKTSAGAADTLPIFSVTNLSRTLRDLQKAGVWIYGFAGEATASFYALDLKGNVALVLGSEGDGLRRLTRENCDQLVKIPMPGEFESLNVSVATGIALFEAVRQRQP
jgi:23S rRNA (guanosine2251-2'-O)-methyltransferase